MKLTNGEIFNAKKPIEKLLDKELPVKTSYGLAKLATKLSDQLQVIGQVIQGLRKTHGTADPKNPSQFNVLPEIDGEFNPEYGKFNEGINELMAQEIEIVLDVVTLPEKVASVCEKCGHTTEKALEIEPSVLMALEKFVKV